MVRQGSLAYAWRQIAAFYLERMMAWAYSTCETTPEII